MAVPEAVYTASEVVLERSALAGDALPRPWTEANALRYDPEPRGRRGWLIRRALAGADVLGLSIAFLAASLVFGPRGEAADAIAPVTEYLLFSLTLPVWLVVAKLYGLYDRDEERTDHSTADDFVGILHVVTIGAWLVVAGSYFADAVHVGVPRMLAFWAAALVLVTLGRVVARALCRRHPAYVQKTIIVGAGEVGTRLAEKLRRHAEYGVDVVGLVDDRPKDCSSAPGMPPIIGASSDLEGLVEDLGIDRVIIAFSNESSEQTLDVLRSLRRLDVQVDIVPRLFEIVAPGVAVHTVEGVPVLGLPAARLSRSSALLKRAFDLALLAVVSLVLVPLFAVVALAIKLDSPGPVFFRQVRRGRSETTFRIWKFRTMWADADRRKAEFAHLNKHNGHDPRMFKIENDPRVTRVGRILRRLSLDELPQLINVATGEMSLVGPRPLILDEDRHVEDWARTRVEIRPGITGLWQVHGRSAIPFDEMVKLDYLYATTWSLWGDLKLLARTVPALARAGDA